MNKHIALTVIALAISTQASASTCYHPDEEGGGYWCAFVPIVDAPDDDKKMHLSELVLNPETQRYELKPNLSVDPFQERTVWSDQLGEFVPYGMALRAAYESFNPTPNLVEAKVWSDHYAEYVPYRMAANAVEDDAQWGNSPNLVARGILDPCPSVAAKPEPLRIAALTTLHFDH